MPVHLPPEEMLADYAAGTMSPGLALLVASHLTHAPQSRAIVEDAERVGGALLGELEPEAMSEDALDAIFGRIDAPSDAPEVQHDRADRNGPLPGAVIDAIGMPFDQIPWKFRMPGVSVFDLEGYGDETVQLLRARPGVTVPQHTHEGTEFTLVLKGTLLDEGVAYHEGDLAFNDEHDDHQPRVIGSDTCYCLIVQQGALHFTGRFSRILNYLGE